MEHSRLEQSRDSMRQEDLRSNQALMGSLFLKAALSSNYHIPLPANGMDGVASDIELKP